MVCAPWAHRCVHDGTVGCLEYHAYHIRVVGTGVCESGAQLVSETCVGADIIVSPLCIHHGCTRVYIMAHLVLYSAGWTVRIMQQGGDGIVSLLCIHHGCARVYFITHLVLYSAWQMMQIMQRGGDGFAARWWTHDHRVVNTSHASPAKNVAAVITSYVILCCTQRGRW